MNKGILASILSAVFFGLTPMFSKLLTGDGLSANNVVQYLFLGNFIFSTILCKVQKIKEKPTPKQIRHLCIMGIVGTGMTTFFLTSSYDLIPLGNTTVIHYLYPALVTIYMVVTRREEGSREKVIALCLSIVGLVCISGVSPGGKALGYIFAFLSAITFGIYITANQNAAYSSLSACKRTQYLSIFTCATFFVVAVIKGDLALPPSGKSLLYLLGMSICSSMAHSLLAYGVTRIGAVTAAFTSMLEPITSILVGVLIFNETFSLITVLGMGLILSAVLMIGLESARHKG